MILQALSSLPAYESAIQRIIVSYWRYFCTVLAIFFALYFQEFAHYTLRVDEEFLAYDHVNFGYRRWVLFGRWGAWIIYATLVAWPLNPYYSLVCFGLLLSASFLILCRTTQTKLSPLVILSFALFAGFPNWYYILEFKGTLIANGFGVFFAVVAGAAFASRRPFADLLFVLCLVAAISMYQAVVLVTLAVCVASLIVRSEKTSASILFPLAKLFLLTVCAVGLYLLIWQALRAGLDFAGLDLAAANYISSQLEIARLLNDPGTVISKTVSQLFAFYSGVAPVFYDAFPLTGILFCLGLLSLVLRLCRHAPRYQAPVLCLLLLALLGVPFLLHLLSAGTLAARVLFAAAVVYWFVVVQALQSAYPAIRLSGAILALLVVFQYFQIASVASFSHQFVASHDRLVASQVYQRIVDEVELFDRQKTYPVDFVGALPFPNAASYVRGHSAVTGSSLFEWDAGNPYRVSAFLHLLGMGRFRIIDAQERSQIRERVETMPAWPSRGSIRIIDGIIVVKFGDYSSEIRKAMEALAAKQEPR